MHVVPTMKTRPSMRNQSAMEGRHARLYQNAPFRTSADKYAIRSLLHSSIDVYQIWNTTFLEFHSRRQSTRKNVLLIAWNKATYIHDFIVSSGAHLFRRFQSFDSDVNFHLFPLTITSEHESRGRAKGIDGRDRPLDTRQSIGTNCSQAITQDASNPCPQKQRQETQVLIIGSGTKLH